ncbi:MAG: superoxide dismutase family protein [Ruminococcus sp.]|nr:superoxide dismutase family protein [Ruminococcus sp.]
MNRNVMPEIYAVIKGSPAYPDLQGMVTFSEVYNGTLVTGSMEGLPDNQNGNFYGFHIHEGGSCTGDATDPFKDAGGHYNPTNQEHPFHAGDMPVIMGNQGAAWFQFYTNRFYPEEIVGKTVVVHDMPDDFRSQPSGDSGMKIGCGVVEMRE